MITKEERFGNFNSGSSTELKTWLTFSEAELSSSTAYVEGGNFDRTVAEAMVVERDAEGADRCGLAQG